MFPEMFPRLPGIRRSCGPDRGTPCRPAARDSKGRNSIAISGHKFFGMDEPAGLFLTTMEVKENQNPFNITYLNGSMPMINCSRYVS